MSGVPKSQCSPSASHAMSCQSFNSREEDREIWGQRLYVPRKALGQLLAFSHSACLIRRNNVDPDSSTTGDVEANSHPQHRSVELKVNNLTSIYRCRKSHGCAEPSVRQLIYFCFHAQRAPCSEAWRKAWVRRSCLHATTAFPSQSPAINI